MSETKDVLEVALELAKTAAKELSKPETQAELKEWMKCFGTVTKVATKIIDQAVLACVNKSRCRQLAERIQNMESIVNELQSQPRKLIEKPLNSYVKCIVLAGELVQKSMDRSRITSFLFAKGDKDRFDQLFDLMGNTLKDLHLALGTDQGRVLRILQENAEKESGARAKDMQDLQEMLEAMNGKLDRIQNEQKQGFQLLNDKLRILFPELEDENPYGVSSDPGLNRKYMEHVWKRALADGKMSEEENIALHSTAVGFGISDEEEKDIIRTALNFFRKKLSPVEMTSLESQVKQYRSYKKTRHGESSHVRKIPFNELVIKESIGKGGFGKIFKAEWHYSDVACKMLLDQKPSEKAIADFKKELNLYSSLSHPCIVTMHGACMDPGKLSIISEFMEGGSLFDKLKISGPLKREHAVKIAVDIAKGMSYLSSRGVIHRDLKSSNVLLNENGSAKLSDFGLSRIKEESTTLAQQVGNASWMAPELFQETPIYSEASDVYAFGVIMWELLTGKRPFEGRNEAQIARMSEKGERPSLDGFELGDPFVVLMRRCWDHRPVCRPAFQHILGELRQMGPLQRAPSEPLSPPINSLVEDFAPLSTASSSSSSTASSRSLSSSSGQFSSRSQDGSLKREKAVRVKWNDMQ